VSSPTTPHSTPSETSNARPAQGSAVFLLDEAGGILSANTAAEGWWDCAPESLIDRPFVTLFAFEVVSDDPEILATQ